MNTDVLLLRSGRSRGGTASLTQIALSALALQPWKATRSEKWRNERTAGNGPYTESSKTTPLAHPPQDVQGLDESTNAATSCTGAACTPPGTAQGGSVCPSIRNISPSTKSMTRYDKCGQRSRGTGMVVCCRTSAMLARSEADEALTINDGLIRFTVAYGTSSALSRCFSSSPHAISRGWSTRFDTSSLEVRGASSAETWSPL